MDKKSAIILAVVFGGLFVALFGFLSLAYIAVQDEDRTSLVGEPAIGVIEIKGVIESSDKTLKALRRFKKDDDIKALLVRIESPGGAVAPSQEIYSELRAIGEKKPVVCSMGDLAASGGYYIAVGCRTIVANPGTLTGSIGVISQMPYVGELAHALKFQMVTIKSGEMKDVGNPFREMEPKEREYFQGLMDRVHEQFIAAVATGRNMDIEKVRPNADGRVLTGEDALQAGLVDKLGSFNDAIELAATQAKIEGEPKLRYPPEEKQLKLREIFAESGQAIAHGVIEELSGTAGVESRIRGPAYLLPQGYGR
jgi:protease-4